jgi:amidase
MKIFKVCILNIIFIFLGCNTFLESKKKDLNDFKYLEIDIITLNNGYLSGDYSIEEVTQAYIDRIQSIDKNGPTLNSIITINPDAISIAKSDGFVHEKEVKMLHTLSDDLLLPKAYANGIFAEYEIKKK